MYAGGSNIYMCIPLPFVPSRLVHVHAFFNGLVAHLKKLGLKFDWKQLKPVWLGDVSPYHNNWGIRSTAYLNAHTIGYCLCKIIQFSSRTLKKKKTWIHKYTQSPINSINYLLKWSPTAICQHTKSSYFCWDYWDYTKTWTHKSLTTYSCH